MSGLLRRAGIGAATIVGVAFVPFLGPFAPLVGGGVAGRLSEPPEDSGIVAGVTAGLLASVGVVPLVLAGSALAATVSNLAAALVVSAAVTMIVYVAGLAAVGGYLGARSVQNDPGSGREQIDRLRQQYVDGALTELEFERRLEEVLAGQDRTRAESASERQTEPERAESRR